LGGFGARAETVEQVREAVRAAHASGKPAVVHVPVRSVLSPFMEVVGF
jgi:acetolactate synthase-1/2/3 large subunit